MLSSKSKAIAGFTLVEMMVGIVVGLIVLWGMSSVYLNSSRSSRTTTAANQLNQDMRAVMDIMANDIRRAGYWQGAAAGVNPFTCVTGSALPCDGVAITDIQIAASGACVLYSYDATHAGGTAGVVDAGIDIQGFRLNANVVQTLDSAAGLATTGTGPCAVDADWQNLTDERSITVTQLTMTTGDSNDTGLETGSKCIAFKALTYDEAASSTFTEWTARPTTGVYRGPACAAAAPNAVAASASDATNTFIETRQVRISLTANSVVDPTLSRTLTETVLVRNNRVVTP